MLLKKILEEELDFMESFFTPNCLIESLFNDFDNMANFDEEKFGKLRTYQLPFISHETLIDTNIKELSPKERFQLRKKVGDCVCFGARKYGKTKCVEELDLMISMLHLDGEHIGFSSIDAIHIRGVLDKISEAVKNHPIFKIFKPEVRAHPTYLIRLKNGCRVEGINMNLQSKNPGNQFFQKHLKRLYIEEASFETEQVYNKRKEAQAEVGCIFRVSGMTNFTKHSPAGRMFYNLRNRTQIINLPQFVNPLWDENEKRDRIEEYGGEDSIGYRVFVKGEVVEEGVSEFDMERIRPFYRKDQIKHFEITKDKFTRFRDIIIIERPKNANSIFISADIGERAGTEIIIHAKINKKYRYIYNITLYNLTDDEQKKIFIWLAEKIKANIIAIDCGDGTGRAIYRGLEEVFPKENLVWYDGSKKIQIDFERDKNNNVIFEKGKPKYREEYMSEWSVRRLKTLLYEGMCDIPIDYKFDSQINSVMSIQRGNRKVYVCVSENDHMFDAWRIFAIAQWITEFNIIKPIKKDWGIGVIG